MYLLISFAHSEIYEATGFLEINFSDQIKENSNLDFRFLLLLRNPSLIEV